MQVTDHIAALRAEGPLLARAAERAGPDAPVPACPGWRIRDLVRHVGNVHRWATGYVVEQHPAPVGELTEDEMVRSGAGDKDLPGWFLDGHQRLVSALEQADPGMTCWTFLAAPSPLAFWARRQAHETAIHRVDAQLAEGTGPAGLDRFAPGSWLNGHGVTLRPRLRTARQGAWCGTPSMPCWACPCNHAGKYAGSPASTRAGTPKCADARGPDP